MSPFLDEEDDYTFTEQEPVQESRIHTNFFKDEKKFFVIGGVAAAVACLVTGYVLYFNSKPVNLEELPVIRAETTPIKEKPKANEQVQHQDKTVYDNISGNQRKVEEKVVSQPEEVVSVSDVNVEETLTDEEKNSIIQAFDELAPEKEYKINYVSKNKKEPIKADGLTIVEEETKPPLNIVREEKKQVKTTKKMRIKDVIDNVATKSTYDNSSIMVQVASVSSKASAEAEYSRILRKNQFLKSKGKRIFKVDLGKDKGIKYRVQVGPFSSRAEAKKAVASLKNNGFSSYISK
ncbi:MAG: SPOR domain-containing protein [Alphaproteobacteria bacterium]|nr:SPOR domain-containing protein [Alphaproteobacteria bacterium]